MIHSINFFNRLTALKNRLDREHKTTRDDDTLKRLQYCKAALDELLTCKAEGALRSTSQRYYEMWNRASRLLACQLRKAQSNHIASKIRHPTSLAEVSHPEEVTGAFQTFYKNLSDAPDEAQSVAKFKRFLRILN